MQTFLPYPDIQQSMTCLDYRRLGKQRVEALQIYNALSGKSSGWVNHPATVMWRGHIDALCMYHDYAIKEWVHRGYNNSMRLFEVTTMDMPRWFGDPAFHASHRSNLLRKDPGYYSKYGWSESSTLPYIWPQP